jgi:hypothetical protein
VAGLSFRQSATHCKRIFLATGEMCPQCNRFRHGFANPRGSSLPNYLHPRRQKIFGPAPSHPLDGNAKARVWAAAGAYNAVNRQPRQHWGPLTRATMDVLKAILWRFHGADGGGRCFPSFERIAAAAKCHRDTVCEAIKALEEAGILTWVNRITRIRHRGRDLFGVLGSVWQVIRTSNAYRFIDPLDRQGGRRGYKSENPTRPPNQEKQKDGARLDGARVMQEEPPRPPPVPTDRLVIALRREHGSAVRASLSPPERAALIARLDAKPTKADWALYERDLEARLLPKAVDAT